MIRFQQINFHLSTDETIFAQIVRLEDRSFGSQVTGAIARQKRHVGKDYEWLRCDDAKTSNAVFAELVNVINERCAVEAGRRLVMVSNPQGWELVSKVDQKAVVGVDVSVIADAPLGLV